jgi:hypothetical protein
VRPETFSGKAMGIGPAGLFIKGNRFKARYGIRQRFGSLLLEKRSVFIFYKCPAHCSEKKPKNKHDLKETDQYRHHS